MNGKLFIRLLFGLVTATYPFIVFFGLQVWPPGLIGLILLVFLLMRMGVLSPGERRLMIPIISILLVYALASALTGSEQMLLLYPVLVNLALLVLFAYSLKTGEPILLRIVRARGVAISSHGPRYLHILTLVWSVFFACNGLVALLTVFIGMDAWLLYNGLIAYLLIAALVIGEILFRRRYKKAHGLGGP